MKDPAAVEYFVADHAPRQSDLVDLASGPASIATKAQPCMTKSDLVQNCPTKKFTQTEMSLNPQSSETSSQAQQSMVSAADLWDSEPRSRVVDRAVVQLEAKTQTSNAARKPNLVHAQVKSAQIEPLLPFEGSEDLGDFQAPVKPVMKPGLLKNTLFTLPTGVSFVDKVLPRPVVSLSEHDVFNAAYYIDLHYNCIAPGRRGQYEWGKNTPNYLGARIKLRHTTFNLDSWRKHLVGYESPEIVQFLEFGFTLGLQESPTLASASANHGSAYQYYP